MTVNVRNFPKATVASTGWAVTGAINIRAHLRIPTLATSKRRLSSLVPLVTSTGAQIRVSYKSATAAKSTVSVGSQIKTTYRYVMQGGVVVRPQSDYRVITRALRFTMAGGVSTTGGHLLLASKRRIELNTQVNATVGAYSVKQFAPGSAYVELNCSLPAIGCFVAVGAMSSATLTARLPRIGCDIKAGASVVDADLSLLGCNLAAASSSPAVIGASTPVIRCDIRSSSSSLGNINASLYSIRTEISSIAGAVAYVGGEFPRIEFGGRAQSGSAGLFVADMPLLTSTMVGVGRRDAFISGALRKIESRAYGTRVL